MNFFLHMNKYSDYLIVYTISTKMKMRNVLCKNHKKKKEKMVKAHKKSRL